MPDDQELVEQVLQGDQEAYAKIIDRYKTRIYALLLRMLGQPQDAQDLAQEVFIKAFYHLKDYKSSNRFSAWLFRIATNHCIDAIRKRRKILSIPIMEDTITTIQTPEDIFLEKEGTKALHQHILSLSEKYRMVFLLRHVEHLSYQEISDILGIPKNVVQVRLHRARKELRERVIQKELGGIVGGTVYEMFD